MKLQHWLFIWLAKIVSYDCLNHDILSHLFRIYVKTPGKEIPHFPAHIRIADVIFNLEIIRKNVRP